MIGLSTLPRAKVVISKGLPVKSSKESVYEHEKATAWGRGFCFDIAPISSVANWWEQIGRFFLMALS
jgi:hypothetical protein